MLCKVIDGRDFVKLNEEKNIDQDDDISVLEDDLCFKALRGLGKIGGVFKYFCKNFIFMIGLGELNMKCKIVIIWCQYIVLLELQLSY